MTFLCSGTADTMHINRHYAG